MQPDQPMIFSVPIIDIILRVGSSLVCKCLGVLVVTMLLLPLCLDPLSLPPSRKNFSNKTKNQPCTKLLNIYDENNINVVGVPILSEQLFLYTGREMDFIWEAAGISLHFPTVHDMESIKISVAVVAKIDEDSILPPRYRYMPAVSATYKIKASATLPAPVRIKIEHCAILENEDELISMVAHKGPPHYFQPLPANNFSLQPSYAEMHVKSFSLFRFFWNLLSFFPTRLSLQVFYHKDSTATIVVTKNLNAIITAVRGTIPYIHVEDWPMSYETKPDAFAFSLPVDSNGWHISSNVEPAEIKTLDIDAYEPGEICPKLKVTIKWTGSGDPKEEIIKVPIHGGSITSFALQCSHKIRDQSQTQQVSLRDDVPHNSLNWTLQCEGPLLNRIIAKLKDVDWKSLHNELILHEETSIGSTCRDDLDPVKCRLGRVVKIFINTQKPEPCFETVDKIASALERLDPPQIRVANELREMCASTGHLQHPGFCPRLF
ncbi:hypothetical protein GBAR_LOCUS24751 [Geodia barretti]|uniref:Uncharacterized protein n=2 Tax=Geodia barretti TaxID=519541 RepID=A0AA35X9R6_GEOBA|nr:hypothetical protein GBAR_LOCUS24751 [Geodia barretti]